MKHCLVVDDSSVVRKVARRILEGFDFTVSEAEDGGQALEMCRRGMPDMILLDWHLPAMEGIDVVASLRKLDHGREPKVLFCVSEADVAQIAKALRAGADEYILKPFDRAGGRGQAARSRHALGWPGVFASLSTGAAARSRRSLCRSTDLVVSAMKWPCHALVRRKSHSPLIFIAGDGRPDGAIGCA